MYTFLFYINFRLIRFEDLAFNPKVKIEKIFHYLKVPMDPNVMEYLRNHSSFRGINNVNIVLINQG